MRAMHRNFVMKLRLSGFRAGLSDGLASSVHAFDAPSVGRPSTDPLAGLKLDVEAMRNDVIRARRRIFGTSTRHETQAGSG